MKRRKLQGQSHSERSEECLAPSTARRSIKYKHPRTGVRGRFGARYTHMPARRAVLQCHAACSAGTRWCQCWSMASSSSAAHRYAQNRTGFGVGGPLLITMPKGSDGATNGMLVTGLLLFTRGSNRRAGRRSTVHAVVGGTATETVTRPCGDVIGRTCRLDSDGPTSGRVRRTHRLGEDEAGLPPRTRRAATPFGIFFVHPPRVERTESFGSDGRAGRE